MSKTGFDTVRARRDTPGCQKVLHFNNAGASLMPRQVLKAITRHVQLEAEIGGYEASDLAHEQVEHAYDAIGRLIGCKRDEVAIVENATRAWDMAFYAIPFRPGDRILTCVAEYCSNYIAFLQVARRTGAIIDVIPDDEFGQISIEALRNMVDERVKLIAITHVPTNSGLVNPAAEIGEIAREAKIPYLLDACQAVGQMPVDVNHIKCDMLSATGRKFLRGPRGVGFLYVRRDIVERLEPPLLDVHAAPWVARDRYEIRPDARRFENWETNYASKIGLGVAADYALSWGLDQIWARVQHLSTRLRRDLSAIPGIHLHDLGKQKCGIVSFTLDRHRPEEVQALLGKKKMNVRVSSVGYTRLDMERRGLESVVRASVHYYNTEQEIDQFCAAVGGMAEEQNGTRYSHENWTVAGS
ncbi:MAG: aminotransferase class V-fold PLP-dependent enzyme [Ignavibacteria bacterium]|nr:aminotransferase class V-fold PLP-dependent enzyme [Ignavibacteria bacterium]